MNTLKIDIKHTRDFINPEEIEAYSDLVKNAFKMIYNKTGAGNNFLGWVNLPTDTDNDTIEDIYKTVNDLSKEIEVFVVIGIGGSYLGARAVIDALNNPFNSFKAISENRHPHIVYAGHNLSQDYLCELLEFLKEKEYAVAVVSKSGTTTEPAVAFRLIKEQMLKKYGEEKTKERIIAVTDKEKGALKMFSDAQGYKTYIIPDDVGGRYSVLTPVGLLPIAMAGYDISALLNGAHFMLEHISETTNLYENPAALYAIIRNILYRKGKSVEIMASYNSSLSYMIEWWKQLFGESEGKELKGIFPAGVNFTTDLHSLGQYIQDGLRMLFVSTINVEKPLHNLTVPYDPDNIDGLNYLAGREIDHINKKAYLGTTLAHVEGGVPNIEISIKKLDEFNLGQLIYFFEMSCAVSGYLLQVNPFDQPGVEAYKNNMFALLGKPGYEKLNDDLMGRINK
ncbi:MAG: glucose-6-phosphate isomerase [Bacteroidales bacterium]|nr:glucose-6-phosphate isomerase [Bacteroidales bacterium]